jgi:hypothetical protein
MKRSISSLLIAVLLPIGAAAAVLSTSTDANAQHRYGYGPSPAWVARQRVVYYNGSPHYWYNGRWSYYRGGNWYGYDRDPPELCGYVRDYYGNLDYRCN